MGEFPLMMATKSNNIDLIARLLEYDIDINQSDNDENTSIIYAIESHLNDIAILLITNQQVDISRSNFEGLTPLMVAIKKDSDETCLSILSRQDINISVKDNKGISYQMFNNTAFLTAAMFNSLTILEYLSEHYEFDINETNISY